MAGTRAGSTGKKAGNNENIRSAAQKWIDKADYMYPPEPSEGSFSKRKLIPFLAVIFTITVGAIIIIVWRVQATKAPEPGRPIKPPGEVTDSTSDQEDDLEKIKVPLLDSSNPTTPEELPYDASDDVHGDDDTRAAGKKQAIDEYNLWVRQNKRGKKQKFLATPPFLLDVKNKECRSKLTSVYHGYLPVTSLSAKCIASFNTSPVSEKALPIARDLQYALSLSTLEKLDVEIILELKPEVFKANPFFPAKVYASAEHPIKVFLNRENDFPENSALANECLELVKGQNK